MKENLRFDCRGGTNLGCVEGILYSAVELVEEAGHGGEDCGLQRSEVVLDEQHVSSEKADGCAAEQSHDLRLRHRDANR
jgi:hypothetical protein